MLKGKKIIVTSGPTYEPIDPVRYIGNRSSGKQGHAIAAAFANLGADVYLVSGPTSIESPDHVSLFRVETAQEMEQKVISLLPADLAVFVAAVADWKVADEAREKIKKNSKKMPAVLHLVENPDILYNVAHHDNRPCLIAGFAAETENIEQNAYEKRLAKGADFMIANNVRPEKGTIGGDYNHVSLISQSGISQWPMMSKKETAQKLAEFLAEQLEEKGFSRK